MKTNLLIVEDHESGRVTMGEYFEAAGYNVTLARNREEALERITSGSYPVVITDLRLSPFSPAEGLEVVAAARKHLASAAILMITAYANPEISEQAQQLGADAVLHKPQSLDTLANLAASLVARRS
jgi:CheY-like chemotaxis protein